MASKDRVGKCLIAALSGLLVGLNLSSMAGFLDVMAYSHNFDQLKPFEREALTCVMPIGSILGALASWRLAVDFSPTKTMSYGSLIWVFGCLVMTIGRDISLLYIGRSVAGFGVGVVSAIAPAYQVEMAPMEKRGEVMSFQYFMIGCGILLQNANQFWGVMLTGKDFRIVDEYIKDPRARQAMISALRVSFGIQIVPGVVLMVLALFLPQSPYYLASQDRWNEAHALIAELDAFGDTEHPGVMVRYNQMRDDILEQNLQGQPRVRLLFDNSLWKRLVLGICMQLWNQLSGSQIILNHVLFVMTAAGVEQPREAAMIQYMINVFFTCLGIWLVEVLGRRTTLIIGSMIMSLCFMMMGILNDEYGKFNTEDTKGFEFGGAPWVIKNRAASSAVVVFSCLFVASYAASWGPIPWVYTAEIFPSQLRTRAVGLCTASYWIGNVLMIFFVPSLLNGLALIHMWAAAHETRGHALEAMDTIFNSTSYAWAFPSGGLTFNTPVTRTEDRQSTDIGGDSRPETGIELNTLASSIGEGVNEQAVEV
ncbi:general substrate transporter [Trichoderma barbatum]